MPLTPKLTPFLIFSLFQFIFKKITTSSHPIMALGWKPIHFGLAGMMLVFGSFNTLSVKWADTMTSESVDGTQKHFNHPFLQAIGGFRVF